MIFLDFETVSLHIKRMSKIPKDLRNAKSSYFLSSSSPGNGQSYVANSERNSHNDSNGSYFGIYYGGVFFRS